MVRPHPGSQKSRWENTGKLLKLKNKHTMEANLEQKPQLQIMKVLQETPAAQIGELEFVKNKFIQNYNFCHKDKAGEMMYHRQVVHFKQLIAGSEQLKACDQFSLYACFVTAAVNGYSLDPADSEVYLIPLKGKAYLWRQAGAHVKRLMNSGQIVYADQAKLVYQDDIFEVENGLVVRHAETFKSEIIIAGYVRFVIDTKGNDKYFIYRKSDWEAWKKKSQQSAGDNWTGNGGQPLAAFLRTKIIKHAATDKSWATGNRPALAEDYGVEVEEVEDISHEEARPAITHQVNQQGAIDPPITGDDSFVEPEKTDTVTFTHDDDDF